MARASQGRPARSVQQPRTATQSPPASVESFAALLEDAVNDPGIISAAYRQFHSYSMGNQLLAWQQCLTRGRLPRSRSSCSTRTQRILWARIFFCCAIRKEPIGITASSITSGRKAQRDDAAATGP